jgi:mitochondrial import inner membrane translocase subunit TIM22
MRNPFLAPLFPAGSEPLPPGLTENDREAYNQQIAMQKFMVMAQESCLFKTAFAGAGGSSLHLSLSHPISLPGLAIGAFFSLMSSSFAYEDPLLRSQIQRQGAGGAAGAVVGNTTTQKAREVFLEMGRGMWRSGKGFAKVGALFAGIECVIEGVSDYMVEFHKLGLIRSKKYRAKNDRFNAPAAGFFAGGVLARNSGPRGALMGGLGFAGFSFLIDLYLRKEPEE